MASFSIPLTGLQADSTALNTIANDLSNMNTTGFKSQTTNFSDLFYQQVGSTAGGDPIQVGAGVQVAANETSYTQGSISSTGANNDIALNGAGFFVVETSNGGYEYTRAGDFSTDASGNLVTTNDFRVMGYPAANGVVNTNSPLTGINIPVGVVQEPQATQNISITANLDAQSATGDQFPAQLTVYDSLGASHVATITYTQTGLDTWSYSAALPAGDFTSGTSTPVTGTMTFDSSGNLTSVEPTGATAPSTVGTATGDVSSIALKFSGLADGVNNLNMSWNLLGANGKPTISQVDTASEVGATSQDGYASGAYESFTVGANGTVTASYTNGQTEVIGQLAVANVTNLQGLNLQGNGDYAATTASGSAVMGVAGQGGLGTMQDEALEASNVNISAEFSDLIVAQRAFEANAKSVTTFDTVTQDTINLIH
jgi:flagellar hook protein FlgE